MVRAEVRNKSANSINVYYHPTTAVFIDDHQAFLDSLPMVLNNDLAYQSFIDPQIALDFVNRMSQYNPLIGKKYIYADECDDYSFIHFKLDVDAIQNKARDKGRFLETSVVVVDYAMPGMDGLEFCKSICNPYIKKILLTGVADEGVAIKALNSNVIDFYIKKHSPDVFQQINKLIAAYQREYFTAISTVVRAGLKVNYQFMDDPVLIDHFFNACKQRSIVEYYFHNDCRFASLGFMMVTDHGDCYRLIIFTDDDLKAHIDVAMDANAPGALIDTLRNRTLAPLFPTEDGFYRPDFKQNWRDYFHPLEIVQGRKNYYFSFIREGNIISMGLQYLDIYSFNEHLQDNVGQVSAYL